jgi:excisionase family DNA binding protein
MKKDLITTREAAVIMGVKPRHVWWLITAHGFPAERIGRDYFVSRRDAERFVRQRNPREAS